MGFLRWLPTCARCPNCSANPCDGPAPVITSALTAVDIEDTSFSYTITASNTPTSYNATGLPTGLSVNTATGAITGTPATPAVTNVTISATNACGTGTATLVITISNCPQPTLVCDTIAATKTKCGYNENVGYESTPPKIYLTVSLSGTITESVFNSGACTSCHSLTEWRYSGSCTYPNGYNCTGNTAGGQFAFYQAVALNICIPSLQGYTSTCDIESAVATITPGLVTVTNNATTRTITGSGTCTSSAWCTGSASAVFSSEYTTAALIADTVAALPAYPGTWDGDCGAIRETATDETSYAIQRFKYKFTLPSMTGITGYAINWNEGVTAKSYTWDGVATETGVYTVTEPGSDGTISITSIVATCT